MSGYLATDDTTPSGRLNRVLDVKFRGNQSAMARATGVSQASLSRVVRGVQEPGRRLMCSVAALPGVDDVWVFTGRGEPFPAPRPGVRGGGRQAPVARVILPGPPSEYVDLLTGASESFDDEVAASAPYWLLIGEADPITLAAKPKIAAGDMLLIEADPATWRDDPKAAIDRLVALQVGERSKANYILAYAGRGLWEGELAFDDFGVGPTAQSPTIDKFGGRQGRMVELTDSPDDRPGAKPSKRAEAAQSSARRGQGFRKIVGIVRQLVRRWS